MQEIWKEIEGFSNYRVSNLGRIKRKEIVIETSRGRFRLKENILKGSFSKKAGYQVND